APRGTDNEESPCQRVRSAEGTGLPRCWWWRPRSSHQRSSWSCGIGTPRASANFSTAAGTTLPRRSRSSSWPSPTSSADARVPRRATAPPMQDWEGMRSEAPHAPRNAHDARLATWSTFLQAHARVTRELEHELEAAQDLSLADYDLLYQLAIADGRRLRMSELANLLALSRSGATRLVDRLDAAGLVGRQTSS